MSLTEGLLVVIVIILLLVVLVRPKKSATAGTRTWDCVDRDTGDITAVQMNYARGGCLPGCKCPKCSSPEGNKQAEQVEHFQGCMNGPSLMPDLDCDNCGDSFNYAVHEFGAPGMSYRDWVGTQAVDPATVKNHAEFVKDRVGNDWKQIITGPTYALPDHESYQPTPWIGIRGRPTRVAICNPTEVTDDDVGYYPEHQKVTWRS